MHAQLKSAHRPARGKLARHPIAISISQLRMHAPRSHGVRHDTRISEAGVVEGPSVVTPPVSLLERNAAEAEERRCEAKQVADFLQYRASRPPEDRCVLQELRYFPVAVTTVMSFKTLDLSIKNTYAFIALRDDLRDDMLVCGALRCYPSIWLGR